MELMALVFLSPLYTSTGGFLLFIFIFILSGMWFSAPIYSPLMPMISLNMYCDVLSWSLMALTLYISCLMVLASGKNYFISMVSPIFSAMGLMTLTLLAAFSASHLLSFYFWFETSLIPIFYLILSGGAQPERLQAGVSMLIYTVFASLPLFFGLMIFSENSSFSFYTLSMTAVVPKLESGLSSFFSTIIMMAFLVKFPLFLMHLWLPKAHVEAPVEGSMVLAAILLKLGGYGSIRLLPILPNWAMFTLSVQSMSLLGGIIVGFLCLTQKDMKILIAYSSISHMALVISAIFLTANLAITGAILLMLAHGLASSGLFAAANCLYSRLHTRNMILSKNILSGLPLFSFFWFLLCLSNMSGPPTLNLISEITLILSVFNSNIMTASLLMVIAFLGVAYSLILYSSSQHGQETNMMTALSPLKQREINLLAAHLFPLFFSSWLLTWIN